MKHPPIPHRSTPTPNSTLGIRGGRARIFFQFGAWEIVLASTLLVELGAIAYHARWVPFVRTEVMQEISKIDSAIANRLGAASRYEDQQLSQTKPQSAPLISPIPAEKIFTGPIIETTYEKLSSAAAKGLASAQYHLGLRYAAGAGVPQDETRAAEWFQKAANQGHPGAQRALSELYLRGEGVPKDIVRAYTWASIAMLAQSYPSPELKSIESQMTAHQISDAERRIAAWSKSQATARR